MKIWIYPDGRQYTLSGQRDLKQYDKCWLTIWQETGRFSCFWTYVIITASERFIRCLLPFSNIDTSHVYIIYEQKPCHKKNKKLRNIISGWGIGLPRALWLELLQDVMVHRGPTKTCNTLSEVLWRQSCVSFRAKRGTYTGRWLQCYGWYSFTSSFTQSEHAFICRMTCWTVKTAVRDELVL